MKKGCAQKTLSLSKQSYEVFLLLVAHSPALPDSASPRGPPWKGPSPCLVVRVVLKALVAVTLQDGSSSVESVLEGTGERDGRRREEKDGGLGFGGQVST